MKRWGGREERNGEQEHVVNREKEKKKKQKKKLKDKVTGVMWKKERENWNRKIWRCKRGEKRRMERWGGDNDGEKRKKERGKTLSEKERPGERERERESSRLVFPSRYDLCHQLPSVFPHHFITIRPPLSPLTSQETLHYFLIHFSLSLFILAFPGLKCSAWLQLRSCDTIRDTSSLTTLTHSVQRHRKRLGRRRSSITVTDKMTDKW